LRGWGAALRLLWMQVEMRMVMSCRGWTRAEYECLAHGKFISAEYDTRPRHIGAQNSFDGDDIAGTEARLVKVGDKGDTMGASGSRLVGSVDGPGLEEVVLFDDDGGGVCCDWGWVALKERLLSFEHDRGDELVLDGGTTLQCNAGRDGIGNVDVKGKVVLSNP
jgi:hypothetical protein